MTYREPFPDADVTERIIGVFLKQALPKVRKLGATRRAEIVRILAGELKAADFDVFEPVPPRMRYRRRQIGQYQVDLVVDRQYAIVVKRIQGTPRQDLQRLRGALHQTGLPTGFVFNFGNTRKRVYRVDAEVEQ